MFSMYYLGFTVFFFLLLEFKLLEERILLALLDTPHSLLETFIFNLVRSMTLCSTFFATVVHEVLVKVPMSEDFIE